MSDRRVVLDRLINRKRVSITPRNYTQRMDLCLFLIFSINVVSSVSILYYWGLSFVSVGVVGAISLLISIGLLRLKKKISSAVVKGDTLIINRKGKTSCVTSLRSIQHVHTSSYLGIQWTQLNYKLDGRTRSNIIVNRSSSVPFPPEKLLRKAIQLSKKQRANRKPGSVSAA